MLQHWRGQGRGRCEDNQVSDAEQWRHPAVLQDSVLQHQHISLIPSPCAVRLCLSLDTHAVLLGHCRLLRLQTELRTEGNLMLIVVSERGQGFEETAGRAFTDSVGARWLAVCIDAFRARW